MTDRAARGGTVRAAALLTALLAPTTARADDFIDGIMARIAALPARTAPFTEEKHLSSLSAPLVGHGQLVYRPPGHLEKDTETPIRESLVIDGDTLTIAQAGAAARSVPLDASPALRAVADTLRAAVAGDMATLRSLYAVEVQGGAPAWRLLLTPIGASLRAALVRVTVDGSQTTLRQIDIQQVGGDEQRITIQDGE
jgi:outer membrane lipoprotein-sorting protein